MTVAIAANAVSSLLFLALTAACAAGMLRHRRLAFPLLFLAIAFAVIAVVCVSNILERALSFAWIDRCEEYLEAIIIPFILLSSYAWSAADRLERNRAYVGELHHRVKNNLQVMESLLDLQMGYCDGAERRALGAARARADVVGLTERMAMESGELDDIEMGTYLRSVVERTLSDGEAGPERGSEYRIECADTRLCASCALPCGLIVSELVASDLRAPPGDRPPRAIRLGPAEGGKVGLGLEGFPPARPGMPSDLIEALLTQLGAAPLGPSGAGRMEIVFAPRRQRDSGWGRRGS